jgi:hypothetical protein
MYVVLDNSLNQSYQSINTLPYSDSFQLVELHLSGRNLADLDFFSKSDPYLKIYYKRSPVEKETYLGRT